MRLVLATVSVVFACACGSVSGKGSSEAPPSDSGLAGDGAARLDGGRTDATTDGPVGPGPADGAAGAPQGAGGGGGSSLPGSGGAGGAAPPQPGAGGAPVQPIADGGAGLPNPGGSGVVLRGGIVTLGPAPAAAGSIRLVRQNISISTGTTCKDNVCLHGGGIKP